MLTDLDQPFRAYFQKFHEYLRLGKGYSIHTVEAYGRDVMEFLLYLQREGLSLEEMEKVYFRSYFAELSKRNQISKRTQARKINALRSFYRLLVKESILKSNPAQHFTSPRYRTSLPKPFYPNETEQILETAGNTARAPRRAPVTASIVQEYYALRDRIIVEMLYTSGMRISELCSVTSEQVAYQPEIREVSEESAKIKILGKGSKERYVFLGRKCCDLVRAYLPIRSRFLAKKKTDSESMFLNHTGKPLSPRGVRYILKQLDKELSMPRGIHPHRMRHTFATDLLNSGADIRAVQEMLGHSSLSTTQKYIQISRERLRDIYRLAHPHAKMKRPVDELE